MDRPFQVDGLCDNSIVVAISDKMLSILANLMIPDRNLDRVNQEIELIELEMLDGAELSMPSRVKMARLLHDRQRLSCNGSSDRGIAMVRALGHNLRNADSVLSGVRTAEEFGFEILDEIDDSADDA